MDIKNFVKWLVMLLLIVYYQNLFPKVTWKQMKKHDEVYVNKRTGIWNFG